MERKLEKILVATSNQGKFREMGEVLRDLPCKILSLTDVGIAADYEETGATFAENALGKARYYATKSGLTTIAEDSGILVEALKEQLGVKTRRWGKGENASDEEWIAHFLTVMSKFENEDQRNACFVCCAALAMVDEKAKVVEEFVFEGRTEGVITKALEAPIYAGLPLSSCFRPNGFAKVYAALDINEKNRVSHRGKALHALVDFLMKA